MSLLARIQHAGVRLELADDGELFANGALTDLQISFLRANKAAIVHDLRIELSRRDHGVRGDGRAVNCLGHLLGADGFVLICEPCDGGGCERCAGGGLQLAFPP